MRRSVRRSESAFLAEGPQAVREAVRFHDAEHPRSLRVRVLELFVEPDAELRHPELVADAESRGIRVLRCTAKAIASLSDAVTPQGIVARCAALDQSLDVLLAGSPRLLALAHDVRDPGNAGTIIRCADAAGADGVLLLGDSVDVYNGKTVRASAGSIFHLPVVIHQDAAEAIAAVQAQGLQVIAAEGEALDDLDDAIDAGRLAPPTAWLFGNEARGLPDEIAELADLRLRIGIRGLAESLNLSTAAAICLFASARAHR